MNRLLPVVCFPGVLCLLCPGPLLGAPDPQAPYWTAPDRGQKVAALIPGRRTPTFTPETLFADWTRQQIALWDKDHPAEEPSALYRRLSAVAPTDAELTADFTQQIAPRGRLRNGDVPAARADAVLITYCPFCGSQSLGYSFDSENPYHAQTTCCGTHLYGREQDFPPDYALAPNTTVPFSRLDDTTRDIPCTLYTDKAGVVWELYVKTIFDYERWCKQDCDMVREYSKAFARTGDPLYPHKIAVILDKVADAYYGMPLAAENKLCMGKDGQGLTRAEWEAVPRPAIFEVSYLGAWGRRLPFSSPGWLNMMDEHIWVEPFARVRHHPAFKQVSSELYGDPEALDRKIMGKLMRELSLMFQSVFSQKLLHNYQEAIYIDLWLLGVLLQDEVLLGFAGPCQELSMYNHTYQDGMNGEGAPNYMAMPGGYYYPVLKDPAGWLQYQPGFLQDNPFYEAAGTEWQKTTTVRGLQLEFGDQHEYAFASNFSTDPQQVAERERLGSRNWAGYGVGLLRVGGAGHRQEVGLSYTRATLHNAQDALSLECWVDGVPVLRRGGYAANWHNARLQWERPEFAALRAMDYPHEIIEGEDGFGGWSWVWAHSPLCQNGVTVESTATGRGWGDNRGYGECVTFKGGEEAGSPGSGFQVLDVKDHYSWQRVGKQVQDFRRTLIGIEGPDGRPYVLDLLHLVGGQQHALYSNAWAERVQDSLPAVRERAEDLAQVLFGDSLPEDTPDYRIYRHLRQIERPAPPGGNWDLTWATDYGAYGPRDPAGKPYRRPIPDNVGKVRLRMLGLDAADGKTELLRGKGPWVAWLRQPLPGGQRVDGNVAFVDARDFLIEARKAEEGQELESLFVHVLEGFREGDESAIRSMTALSVESLSGPERQTLALELSMAAGHTDTVIYQSEPGEVKLPDGTQTDARYALLRRDASGTVIQAEACSGTYVGCGRFRAEMSGDLTGTIVDLVGDLTGTRRESAIVIRPDKPWPEGDNLAGRQLLVRVGSDLRDPCNEGYRMEKTTALGGGLWRIDLQDSAPLVVSWHEVKVLPPDRPNVLRTNRPMVDHGNTPWYCGMKAWFPERDRTYTIQRVNEVGGGYGGDTLELAEGVDLAADGVEVGDWYVIYAVQPGQRVVVRNDLCWRAEPVQEWRQFSLRAGGDVRITAPELSGDYHVRTGGGPWRHATGEDLSPAAGAGGQVTQIICDKPEGLDLDDTAPPALLRLTVDGDDLDPTASAVDLGTIEPPRQIVAEFLDERNALDPVPSVLLDGSPVAAGPEGGLTVEPVPPRGLRVSLDIAKPVPADPHQIRRHVVQVAVTDRSVDRRRAQVQVSYTTKVPLDPEAVYLSDLKPVRSFAHAGLILDRDYVGDPAAAAGRLYPKCVMICPEPSPEGAHGEVVYEPPRDKGDLALHSDVVIEEAAGINGSVVFLVQTSDSLEGPWQTLYTSPTMRGGMEPETIVVPLGTARYLRLYTGDAGDGINSDHALWGNARLKAR